LSDITADICATTAQEATTATLRAHIGEMRGMLFDVWEERDGVFLCAITTEARHQPTTSTASY
jgi:hypothetical protein